jgi:hypothetical protein
LAKLGAEFGSPIVIVVTGAVGVLLVVPDEFTEDELPELLQPENTADAIMTPATPPVSRSMRLIWNLLL